MGARRVAAVPLLASGLSAALAPAGAQAACTRATNIEAIIDDSGSMSLTDANRLRVQAMDLLINALDPGTTLGSIEFGGQLFSDDPPAADVVFTPEGVRPTTA